MGHHEVNENCDCYSSRSSLGRLHILKLKDDEMQDFFGEGHS